MTLIPGCRLPLNGRPRFGWWSLDPGMDAYYLRFGWVPRVFAVQFLRGPAGASWVPEALDIIRQRMPVPVAYRAPCGWTG